MDPDPRTNPSFLLATKDFHPQSDPIRAPFLVHAYRLLTTLQTQLEGKVVVAAYDCGELAGGLEAHKNVRFFVVEEGKVHGE